MLSFKGRDLFKIMIMADIGLIKTDTGIIYRSSGFPPQAVILVVTINSSTMAVK